MLRTNRNSGPSARPSVLDLLIVGTLRLRVGMLRAALSALGIAIAIGTVVMVTALPASSQAALDARLTELGADVLRADPVQNGETLRTLPAESLGMLERVGPVTSAAAAANLHLEVRRNARQQVGDAALTALAVEGDFEGVLRAEFVAGSFPQGLVPSVVLGSDAARRLGLSASAVGSVSIDIGGVAFTVVGILAPTPLAIDMQSAVLVSREVAQHWLGFDGRPTLAYVAVVESRIDSVRPVLAATLSPQSPGQVQVSQPSGVLAAKEATRSTFDGLFFALALVSLAVGGVGIANTLFASVLERRRDIGLRRALGARRTDIAVQFLVEALLLSLIGGGVGLAAGAGLGAIWALAQGWPIVIPLPAVGGAFVAAVLTGALAGLAPSIRAARLDPAAALTLE